MNETDKRQAIDEIYMLGKSKQNSSLFILGLKGALTLKNLEEILGDKRKTYNYSYVNVFKKYSIPHDDLYRDLDNVWNVCLKDQNSSSQEDIVRSIATGSAGGAAGSVAAIVAIPLVALFGPFVAGLSMFQIVRVQVRVRKIWKAYKRNCKVYAQEYLQKLK